MMKKILSVLLTLTLLLCTACGGENGSNGEAAAPETETPAVIDSIYTDITGIPGEKIVMTVDGNEIPAAMYFYWAVSCADNLMYQLQMYNMYYGMYSEAFNADGTINWGYEIAEGMTLSQQLEQQIRSTVSFYAAVENMAQKQGVSLTEEDRTAMAEQMAEVSESYRAELVSKDPAAESLSAEEVMEKYLETIGINKALMERISSVYYLFEGLKKQVATPGSAIYLEDDDCNQYGYFADHILISTVDTETRQPLSDEDILKKTDLARDILAQLTDSGDPVELFGRLADEYSEDPGRQTNPDGYIFTPGTMVQEFESATEALKYGEISGIVESDYGYHIILRKDLAQGLELYPEEKAMFVEQHLSALINLSIFDSEITYDDVLTGFDYGKFCSEYSALMTSLRSGEKELEISSK